MRHPLRHALYATSLGVLVLCTSCSTPPREVVVLLPNADGQVGEVAVKAAAGQTTLTAPFTTAQVNRRGEVKPAPITVADAERLAYAAGTDAMPGVARSFRLYFQPNSTELVPESQAELAVLFTEVRRRQGVEVEITGHTDSVGKGPDNDRLSIERAEAMRTLLMQQGLPAQLIRAVGRGERELLVSTPDETNEPRNRRVEILVR